MSLSHAVLEVLTDKQAVNVLSSVTLVFVVLVLAVFTGFYALMYRRMDNNDEEPPCRNQRKDSRRRTPPRADKSPGGGLYDNTFDDHTSFVCSSSSTSSSSFTSSDKVWLVNDKGASNDNRCGVPQKTATKIPGPAKPKSKN